MNRDQSSWTSEESDQRPVSRQVPDRSPPCSNDGRIRNGLTPMSLLSTSVPLAASSGDHTDMNFSAQHCRTLMIGKDLLDETDICRGAENFKDIRNALLSQRIEDQNSLQRCAWPHIIRGRDCTILGGTNCKKGKSLAYLAPLAHLSRTKITSFRKDEEKGLIGPVGLILCGTSKSCYKVTGMFGNLISGTTLSVITIADNNDAHSRAKVMEHTDFIISTPCGAMDLYNESFDKFKFERLRYLIMDDTQQLFKHHLESVMFLVEKIQNFRERRKDTGPLQTIICGTEWNDQVASATLHICEDPCIFIESSMASLQYGDIKMQVHYFVDKQEKMNCLLRLCEGFSDISRVLIISVDPATTEDIRVKLCRISGINTFALDDETTDRPGKIRQLKKLWKESVQQKLIFVVTDTVLKDLEIKDTQYIIHYDLPAGRKGAFADRHMTMWNNFPTVTDHSTRGDAALKSKVPLESHIFITSEDRDFEKIVYKLHDIGVSIPEELFRFAKAEVDRQSLVHKLCDGFKAYGRCIKTGPCSLRHRFTLEDLNEETTVPKVGRIQVELISMVDLNVYIAKLISYYDVANGKKVGLVRYSTVERELQGILNSHFSDSDNMLNYADVPLEIGMYCVVQEQDTAMLYRRGRVSGRFGSGSQAGQYRIFLIDTGSYVVRPADRIFVFPEVLSVKHIKPLCIVLCLSGIKPFDNEPVFSMIAKSEATKKAVGFMFTGKIVLSIGNEVWVNCLVEHKKGPDGDWTPVRNLRVELIKTSNCGEFNPDHMELLYENCEKYCGVNCDNYRALDIIGNDLDNIFCRKEDSIAWAFLSASVDSRHTQIPKTRVFCSYYRSIDEIYVQLDDTCDLLDALIQDIEDYIESAINGKYEKYSTIFEDYYEVGLPVAVYEPVDKKWNRGIIVDKSKIQNEVVYDIFFVDHGDIGSKVPMKNMFPLKKDFMSRLPFQAIRIGCKHVEPLEGLSAEFYKAVKPYFIDDALGQPLDIAFTKKEESYSLNGIQLCRTYACLIMPPTSEYEIGEILETQGLVTLDPQGREIIQRWKTSLLSHYNKIVDGALGQGDEDSDEDANFFDMGSDDDDFDVYLGLDKNSTVEERANLAVGILKDFGAIQSIERNENPEPPLLQNINNKKTPGMAALETGTAAALTVSGTAPSVITSSTDSSVPQLRKPMVEWKQTTDHILIWIYLPDLTDYKLEINEELSNIRILFESKAPDGYGFELELVGRVLPTFVEKSTGQYVTIKFQKLSKKTFWPYLLNGNPNYHWLKRRMDDQTLKADEEAAYNSTDDEDTPSTNLMKKTNGNYEPNTYVSDSDDEEIESDDEILSDGDEEIGRAEF